MKIVIEFPWFAFVLEVWRYCIIRDEFVRFRLILGSGRGKRFEYARVGLGMTRTVKSWS